MTKNYVIICACRQGDRNSIILVKKNAPDWQIGKLNLPGGKLEDGESFGDAAHRELKEETGYEAIKMKLMGFIHDGGDPTKDFREHEGSEIACFRATISKDAGDISPRPEETEQVAWHRWNKVYTSRRLIPNLRVIVPLMLTNCWDWTITDNYRSSSNDYHQIQVNVMSP